MIDADWLFIRQLGTPLLRLLLGITGGLLLASILESLGWTTQLGKLAKPLSRFAHLNPGAASAFALSFVSPHAANAFLSNQYLASEINSRELLLTNLFNALPAYFSHIPTIFLLLWPVIGYAAFTYAGLTLGAAVLRTVIIVILSRFLLPPSQQVSTEEGSLQKQTWVAIAYNAWHKFRTRLPRLLLFTIPIYILMFAAQKWGIFAAMEGWLSEHLKWIAFLKPQAMGIIAFQLMAEFGASLGAASAALADGALTSRDVVIALLVGNVLATPLRVIRHQLPAYMGFYPSGIAIKMVLANQGLRAASMICMIWIYIHTP